jgi:hypothetical protein
VQLSCSALSTIGVFAGQGPSSKVRATSLSRRKSYCLKCSVPNAGPPVVSISMTHESPSASGLLQAANGVGPGAGKADAIAIVLFCATAVDVKAAALTASPRSSGALSLLANSVFCGDDTTRAAAAVSGTGSVAFCATTTGSDAARRCCLCGIDDKFNRSEN